jgi:arsenate reductase
MVLDLTKKAIAMPRLTLPVVIVKRRSPVSLSRAVLSVGAIAAVVVGVSRGVAEEAPLNRKATPFTQALALVQLAGLPQAATPESDISTKATLARGLKTPPRLSAEVAESLFESRTFFKWAGEDGVMDANELQAAVTAESPDTRRLLSPETLRHLDLLATGFDQIDEAHRAASAELVDWIVENYEPGKPLPIVCVCTGNSRRSILTATMVSLAGLYAGLPEVTGYSGGTEPSAFNARTVSALRAIGLEIEPTGKEAPRGHEGGANPVYRVRYATPASGVRHETEEFSKKYDDAANPRTGFAAIMVCSEADRGCPVVKGADARIAAPYLDPKLYDGSDLETVKYAERRDDIGRFALATVTQARLKLREKGVLASQ